MEIANVPHSMIPLKMEEEKFVQMLLDSGTRIFRESSGTFLYTIDADSLYVREKISLIDEPNDNPQLLILNKSESIKIKVREVH